MAKDFTTELDEFIDSVSGPVLPGESQLERLEHAFHELTDVVGRLVDDLDEQDRATELPILQAQILSRAQQAVGSMNLKPWVGIPLTAALPAIVPVVIQAAADKSSFAAKARDAYAVPAIDFAVISLMRVRAGIAPDAPPLQLTTEVSDGNSTPGPAGPTAGAAP